MDRYEQETGHRIYCSAGFNDVCICGPEAAAGLSPTVRAVFADLFARYGQYDIADTRRTGQIATRKYRARKGRRN